MLTQSQIDSYQTDGYLLASGLISDNVSADAEARMWERMEMDPNDPGTWSRVPDGGHEYSESRGVVIFNGLQDSELMACATPDYLTAVSQLIGEHIENHPPQAVHRICSNAIRNGRSHGLTSTASRRSTSTGPFPDPTASHRSSSSVTSSRWVVEQPSGRGHITRFASLPNRIPPDMNTSSNSTKTSPRSIWAIPSSSNPDAETCSFSSICSDITVPRTLPAARGS